MDEPWRDLFRRSWWLDAVAPGEWQEVTVTRDGRTCAHLAFIPRRHRGLRSLLAPRLAPRLGPWLEAGEGRRSKRLAHEEQLLNELVDRLPAHDRFHQHCHPRFTNWLPLYWRGFAQTTRYSYVLDDLSDLDALWDAFEPRRRRDIRSAEKLLCVRDDREIDPLADLLDETFRQQQLPNPFSRQQLSRVFGACGEHQAGRISYAVDGQDRVHAGMFVVWDGDRAYYLLGGTSRSHQGAMTLLMWDAMQLASRTSRSFDFEGSMIRPIAHFFRGFGAAMEPYFDLRRTSRRAEIIDALRVLRPRRGDGDAARR
jgi:antitoxin (DNA-binding transcriptional repressor) of toxin-antitoxin stability system